MTPATSDQLLRTTKNQRLVLFIPTATILQSGSLKDNRLLIQETMKLNFDSVRCHASRGHLLTALTVMCAALATLPVSARSSDSSSVHKEVTAVRLSGPVTIDGKLDEPAWRQVPVFSDFSQLEPAEGKQPSMRTEVRIAYDDAALYVAATMYDPDPDSIAVRLARRDNGQNSDVFGVFFDPYHDHRSGFYFGLDPAGTYYDGTLSNDDWSDASWDGVWEGKVSKNNDGWTAEMRIPFSQLRYHGGDGQVWGINFRRDIARRNENDYAVYTPKSGTGYVSRFIDLTGLAGIPSPRRLEFLPYVTTRAEFLQHAAGDPFHTGSHYVPRVGADLKVGLGPSLTIDATVNPDFGQVEVDPAVVNLSDVETYFNEKRPFFIEGSSTFRFGSGGAVNYWNFNFSNPEFFYTRRIGRAPEGSLPDADFVDVPGGTDILGAAKISGKIGDTWNIGAVQALTGREHAEIQTDDVRSTVEVEPLTYYGVARAQKEFNDGRQSLGVISTTTSRLFKDDRLRDDLNSMSTVAGLDGWTVLDSAKSWVVTGWGAASFVRGNQARMLALQSNSQHYMQRPDAAHYRIDSSTTSMTGYAGRFYLVKQRGNLIVNSAVGILDPRFDNNDLGFLSRAGMINVHIGGGYQWVEPTEWYHRMDFLAAVFNTSDFDGNTTWRGIFGITNLTLPNYYYIRVDAAYNPETVNDRRTRGGPLTLNASGYQIDFEVTSDTRKDVDFDISMGMYRDRQTSWNLYTTLNIKPSANLSLSIGPGLEHNMDYAGWVGAFDDPTASATYGKRYVFALLKQTTLSANIRLNWTFTPQLSLQVYLQPLISAANYSVFAELARPRSLDMKTYGTGGSSISLSEGSYSVFPDGPAPPITFSDPNFNFKSLRGNAVLRWEYYPGSTLYFVWTQTRSLSDKTDEFQFNRSFRQLLDIRPDNIFLVKFTYWWNV